MDKRKSMSAIDAPTIRHLVRLANELELEREDIVNILPMGEGYIMVYYYGEN